MDRQQRAGNSRISHTTQDAQERFDALAADLRQQVEHRLAELFPEHSSTSHGLRAAIAHGLMSPGKRLRPLITLLACRQCGGDPAEALDGACAVEMMHAASLIIDDLPCMDDASLRRNCVATHVAYGEGVSILAAITLVNDAYRIIAQMERIDPRERILITEKLSMAIGLEGLAGGQERDLARHGDAPQGGMREIEQSHMEKTGALFAAAAGIGAVIAGARAVEIEAMEKYGGALGLAYQTFDDVIDSECDETQTGKDAGKDQNRTTVVTLMGAHRANKSAAQWIEDAIAESARVDCGAGAPLSSLARAIEAKFNALTQKS
ncbi:MAG: polyprenyl synthetase family protein [Pseudomonadota bacterium]